MSIWYPKFPQISLIDCLNFMYSCLSANFATICIYTFHCSRLKHVWHIQAYLSLPEGTATAAGLIAMMTDHYNILVRLYLRITIYKWSNAIEITMSTVEKSCDSLLKLAPEQDILFVSLWPWTKKYLLWSQI